jgi:hypothetical protein
MKNLRWSTLLGRLTPALSLLLALAAPADAADSAADDPCRLLTQVEMAAVMPGAKAGQPERSREKYGISACVWEWNGGSFALQKLPGKHGAASEIRGLVSGYTDPLAHHSVRYEAMPGVGDAAQAVVEPVDAARGVIPDMAMLVTHRGGHVLALQCAALARGDRTAALKTLATLGRTAATRL